MSNDYAVSVRGLGKAYKLYSSRFDRALDAFRRTQKAELFTALRDVTFDIPHGEVLAILGKNGSGKSTLLKIIAGVTTATEGTVELEGRVSAMLELMGGFDPELTGVENIYLRALAMGIPREEVEAQKAAIIEFADIGDYIHQPVRTYSSGMRARLGFAVSVSVDPDILIVDEVLAVGDEVFRLKCVEKMESFRKQGKTILFVTHSLFTVKAFCTMGLWLDEGDVKAFGELGDVVLQYEDFLRAERARQKREEDRTRAEAVETASPTGKRDIIEVSGFRMYDESGTDTNTFDYGEDLLFEFTYVVKKPIERLTFCYTVRNAEAMEVYMADKQNDDNVIASEVGEHTLKVRLKDMRLLGGKYLLSGEIWNNDAGFYVGYSNKRAFHIAQEEFLGTGITHIDYEYSNE